MSGVSEDSRTVRAAVVNHEHLHPLRSKKLFDFRPCPYRRRGSPSHSKTSHQGFDNPQHSSWAQLALPRTMGEDFCLLPSMKSLAVIRHVPGLHCHTMMTILGKVTRISATSSSRMPSTNLRGTLSPVWVLRATMRHSSTLAYQMSDIRSFRWQQPRPATRYVNLVDAGDAQPLTFGC
jgi:hypothetical protein